MNVKVSVSGGADSITAAAERIRASLPSALLAGAEAVAECARGMCPVDTGNLRGSIAAAQSGEGAAAYAGAGYAAYVEFGTYKSAAQPFLVPALAAAEDAVLSAVTGGLLR